MLRVCMLTRAVARGARRTLATRVPTLLGQENEAKDKDDEEKGEEGDPDDNMTEEEAEEQVTLLRPDYSERPAGSVFNLGFKSGLPMFGDAQKDGQPWVGYNFNYEKFHKRRWKPLRVSRMEWPVISSGIEAERTFREGAMLVLRNPEYSNADKMKTIEEMALYLNDTADEMYREDLTKVDRSLPDVFKTGDAMLKPTAEGEHSHPLFKTFLENDLAALDREDWKETVPVRDNREFNFQKTYDFTGGQTSSVGQNLLAEFRQSRAYRKEEDQYDLFGNAVARGGSQDLPKQQEDLQVDEDEFDDEFDGSQQILDESEFQDAENYEDEVVEDQDDSEFAIDEDEFDDDDNPK